MQKIIRVLHIFYFNINNTENLKKIIIMSKKCRRKIYLQYKE